MGDALKRARLEISNGNLWRAKEILQGAVGHPPFRPEIYEQFGILLLEMRDLAEAGKFLFLSGARKPEYEAAIQIFLKKHEGRPNRLLHSFPRAARLGSLSDYPMMVGKELARLGLKDPLKDEHGRPFDPADRTPDGRFVMPVLFGILALVALLLILGVIKLFEMVF
jgi:hypothetical protein